MRALNGLMNKVSAEQHCFAKKEREREREREREKKMKRFHRDFGQYITSVLYIMNDVYITWAVIICILGCIGTLAIAREFKSYYPHL